MLQDQGTCTDFTTLAPVVVLPGTLSSQVLHGPCAQPVFIPRGLRALFDTTINPDTAGAKELHGPATIVDPDLVDGITSQPLTAFAETLPPDRVIGVLNTYLESMSDAILDNGGTLVAVVIQTQMVLEPRST